MKPKVLLFIITYKASFRVLNLIKKIPFKYCLDSSNPIQNLELFISIFKSVAFKIISASKLSESITGKSSTGSVGSESFDFPKKTSELISRLYDGEMINQILLRESLLKKH